MQLLSIGMKFGQVKYFLVYVDQSHMHADAQCGQKSSPIISVRYLSRQISIGQKKLIIF